MSFKMKTGLLTCILAGLIFVSGCVPSKPVKEEEIVPPEVLVKKLEANRRKIKTFRGSGLILLDSPELEAKANFEVVIKKPDSIKISVFGPFGIDLAEALVTSSEFYFLDVIRNDLYTGRVKEDVLKRIFKVDLTFDDLMDAFAGAVNLTDKLRSEPDSVVTGEEEYLMTYTEPNESKRSEYTINMNNLAIMTYKLFIRNKLMFEGTYSEFKEFNDVSVPYTTFLENLDRNQKVTIEYREISVNEKIEKLTISIPKGVNRIKW